MGGCSGNVVCVGRKPRGLRIDQAAGRRENEDLAFRRHLRHPFRGKTFMSAYLVLLFAVLSRVLPHTFHATGVNFTAVGGSLLFFGSRMGRSHWQAGIAVAALVATDYYLTVFAYGYAFHVNAYLATWVWYGAICLLGRGLLEKRVGWLRVGAGVLASSTSFFLLSNFMVWAAGGMYAKSLAGLGACFVAAVPFYANDVMSTAMTAGVLFGLPALAKGMIEMMHGAQRSNLPVA
jgi:hypothetical protein